MFRKPLRSATGCLRCRQRKIKCDEERPVCAKCARWNIECLWPAQQKLKSDKPESDSTKALLAMTRGNRAPPLQCYQDGYLAAGYEGFQSENQRQLLENAVEFVRRYTSLGIGDGRGNITFPTTMMLQTSWSRFALSAFTAGAISRWDSRFKTIALSSYHNALVELRLNISSNSVHSTDVRFLTSIFFLGMMEYFAHGTPKAAFNHLSIVARMAVPLQEKLSKSLEDASSRWTIAMISMSITLCANFFWIEPRIYSLFEDSWDTLDAFVSLCVQPLAETYKVCLPEDNLRAIVQLHANRMIFNGCTSSHVQAVLRHIDHVENFIATNNPVSTQLSSSNLETGWAAEICGMRLYVAAVSEPTACSNDRRLRALAEEWRECNSKFLQSLNGSMPHMEILLPMTQLSVMSHLGIGMYYIPLMCIVHDLEWFEEIASVYNSLNIIIDVDVAKRIQSMIETIRTRKKTMHCTLETDGECSARHDGLDILRSPEGVLC